MDPTVKKIEEAAKNAGCDGTPADLIAFATGFVNANSNSDAKEIDVLKSEVARLKELLKKKGGGQGDGEEDSADSRASKKERAKTGTKHTLKEGGKIGGPFKSCTNAPFIKSRLETYKKIKASFEAKIAGKPQKPIKITLPDGTVKEGTSWKTTPRDIALTISKKLAKVVTVAEVTYTGERIAPENIVDAEMEDEDEVPAKIEIEGDVKTELWDVTRPLEGDCTLKLRKFADKDSAEGKTAFWHSSAHVLGQAMERCFGVKLTIGPALKSGFYYDCYSGNVTISESEWYTKIDKMMKDIVKEDQVFERVVCSKKEAMVLFADNPFKLEILRTKVPDGSSTTIYRNGPFVDLCMGPHVPSTKCLSFAKVTSHSATYWRGDDKCDSLQRMYAISFPDKKLMTVWEKNMKARRANDHRLLGTQQKLFFFHELSPGSSFFLPHGARVYSRLMQFIRNQYWQRGYCEVVSPNIFDSKLFKISGHYEKYENDMYWIHDKNDEFGLKPMNCPGHCLMFRSCLRSHRDLPIRYADFGVLHRNELKGALSGLTRVRRFQQDDGHIFCRRDQVTDEVLGALEFMKYVYDIFGMKFVLQRSTRPKKAVGADTPEGIDRWNGAEEALSEALDKFAGKGNWSDNPGDGAFYGPKIDIKVQDCMDRIHQCATVQLDFQLPIRFDLSYKAGAVAAEDKKEKKKKSAAGGKKGVFKNLPNDVAEPAAGFARPVMVHRAMLGSVERMMAILIEHFAGKWPLWCSPRQVMVIPLHVDHYDFALEVQDRLRKYGFYADADVSKERYQKKLRSAVKGGYNYQLVVGKEEMENDTVAIRVRGSHAVEKDVKIDDFVQRIRAEVDSHKKSPELIARLAEKEGS
eukprot:g2879.t1